MSTSKHQIRNTNRSNVEYLHYTSDIPWHISAIPSDIVYINLLCNLVLKTSFTALITAEYACTVMLCFYHQCSVSVSTLYQITRTDTGTITAC